MLGGGWFRMIGAGRAVSRSRLAAAVCAFAVVGTASLIGAVAGPSSFMAPAPVLAQSVPNLVGQVTDEAGVVDGRAADVAEALDALLGSRGVQLYVAFVTTTGGAVPRSFTQATFEHNGLGGNDMLLLVAVQDRRYAWWEDGAVPSLQSTEIDQLLSRTLEPRFQANDYAGGVIDFAGALGAALGGAGGGTVPTIAPATVPVAAEPGTDVEPARDLGPLPGILLGAVLLVAGISAPVGVVETAPDRPAEGGGARSSNR